ncbi:MAG: transcriptional repressor [Saprospiraceae bacterium]
MSETNAEVKNKFSQYLENNNNRKTHERFAILDEIYSNQTHFDAESLYVKMKKSDYRVSRATVYNTIDVLLKCNLIKKHNFGDNMFFFEKTYGVTPHHHMICKTCKSIIEFEGFGVREFSHQISKSKQFKIEDICLNVYGKCEKCNK